jgi:hypothetical protein
MDPVTIFLAAMAAGGKLFEGFAGGEAADLQAKVSAENAALLAKQAPIYEMQAQAQELNADIARAKGSYETTRLADHVTRIIAAQPGRYAAAGLSGTAVSPLVAAAYSASQGQADIEIIRANSELEAAAAKMAGANTRMTEANVLARAAGQNWQTLALKQRAFTSRVAGVLGAGTAFLTVGKKGFGGGGVDAPEGYYGGSPETNPNLVPV